MWRSLERTSRHRRILVRAAALLGATLTLVFVAVGASGAANSDPPVGTWTPVSNPAPSAAHSGLSSVVCVTSTDCWAVGFTLGAQNNNITLAENWNGSEWLVVPSPDAVGATDSQLDSVACVSTSDCWAVGYSDDSASESALTLTERWDGTDWSIVANPDVGSDSRSSLISVTCASSTECWAVGSTLAPSSNGGDQDQTLAELWNGTDWSIVATPEGTLENQTEPTSLAAVTCVTGDDCWAVGNLVVSLPPDEIIQPVFEHWDGTSWSVNTNGEGSGGGDGVIGVTCVSTSDCWAVGSFDNGSDGNAQTLTEQWNGAQWSVVASADTNTAAPNNLEGVTCNNSTDCWAVGATAGYDSPPSSALTERWDGSSWSIVASEQKNSKDGYGLSSVTCADPADRWSVGSRTESTEKTVRARALVEWLMPPTSISISPHSGPPGTLVTVTGAGFPFNETVKVTYASRVSGKRFEQDLNCDNPSRVNGSFRCQVSIPTRHAGSPGSHMMTATSGDSTASTTFTLIR